MAGTGKREFNETQRKDLVFKAEMGKEAAASVHEHIINWNRKYQKYDSGGLSRSAKSYFDNMQKTLYNAKKDIDSLYKEAEVAENDFTKRFGDIAFCMGLYANRIEILSKAMQTGVPTIETNAFEDANFMQTLENVSRLIAAKDVNALIKDPSKLDGLDLENLDCDAIVEYIAEKYRGKDLFYPNPEPVISDVERDLLIKCYEKTHPNDAKTLNKFVSPISKCGGHEKEVQEFKYLAYASPEPYHTVFFRYLPQISISDHHEKDVAHENDYLIFGKKIYIDIDNVFDRNPDGTISVDGRGGYATMFHEIGHGIDDCMGDKSKTLDDEIIRDVNSGIKSVIERHFTHPLSPSDEASVMLILESLEKGKTTTGDPSLDIKRSKVIAEFQILLGGGVNNTSSDVYGGVTDNNIVGDYAHRPDDKGVSYWSNHVPSTEFFANAFSRNMTGYADPLNSIYDNLPETEQAFEELIKNERLQ